MKYKHIFFDLDHTLWDFDKNAEETLNELYHTYHLKSLGLNSADNFIETYTKNNHELWALYHVGKISKEKLREERFKKTFLDLGIDLTQVPLNLEEDYVRICPTKTNLFPNTHEVLGYLNQKYHLHLISNGFKESTEYKVKNNQLGQYFQNIIISEVVGVNKPDKAIFNHALSLAAGKVDESIMIGDSIEADIRGAKSFGMDAIFFNPNKQELPKDIDWEIEHLIDLKEYL